MDPQLRHRLDEAVTRHESSQTGKKNGCGEETSPPPDSSTAAAASAAVRPSLLSRDIQTLVFFDLESSGLAGSVPRARITELAMVAVAAEQFLKLQAKLDGFKGSRTANHLSIDTILPRVLSKLTLCVYPRTTVLPSVTELTGLDNYNLECERPFDAATAALISSFLRRLPPPVSLVAHNGKRFDFPLLLAELAKAGAPTPPVLGVDSLAALRDIFAADGRLSADAITAECRAVQDLLANGAFDDDFEIEFSGVKSYREEVEDSQTASCTTTPIKKKLPPPGPPATPPMANYKRARLIGADACCSSVGAGPTTPVHDIGSGGGIGGGLRDENETTPDRFAAAAAAAAAACSSTAGPSAAAGAANHGPPPPLKYSGLERSPRAASGIPVVRKRLDFNQPPSFSLPELHKHVFGALPQVSHGAEADCIALMRVCAAVNAAAFVQWANEHAQKLDSLAKMW